MNKTIELTGYAPGAIGRITELHGIYYHQHWGMGLYFEAKIATELAAFLNRLDPARDGIWLAHIEGQIAGAIVIDGVDAETEGARLRWFIIAPEFQGYGLGNHLLSTALDFCKQTGFRRVYLTTFAGLDAARHLYEKVGFRLCEEQEDNHWGRTVLEQKFALDLE